MIEFHYERRCWMKGMARVAGVDEAGRGPLAGPVVAAAVIFPPEVWIYGVDDSKKLTPEKREELFSIIQNCALGVGVSVVSHTQIDLLNIYRASMQAMEESVIKLDIQPHHLLIDGPRYHNDKIPHTAIIDGDAKCFAIAAASIIAKVTRDRLMVEYDQLYPSYGFKRHKGYATPEHLEALRKHGPCEIHRRSFRMPRKGEEQHHARSEE